MVFLQRPAPCTIGFLLRLKKKIGTQGVHSVWDANSFALMDITKADDNSVEYHRYPTQNTNHMITLFMLHLHVVVTVGVPSAGEFVLDFNPSQ